MYITGTTNNSRLVELKKYKVGGDFFDQYFLSTNSNIDGVDENLSDITSPIKKIVYYIGGITFTDTIESDETSTTFSFEGQGYNSPDFIDVPIYKDPNKTNIIQNPKINNDVFIVRQVLSAFDKIYKLGEINNLQELTNYAGGSFFNVESN